jgi:hypothetical protein
MSRIYSLNLAAYVLNELNCDYNLHEDEDKPGKYYVQFDRDISEVKEKYRNDVKLHQYLNTFRYLKMAITDKRIGK